MREPARPGRGMLCEHLSALRKKAAGHSDCLPRFRKISLGPFASTVIGRADGVCKRLQFDTPTEEGYELADCSARDPPARITLVLSAITLVGVAITYWGCDGAFLSNATAVDGTQAGAWSRFRGTRRTSALNPEPGDQGVQITQEFPRLSRMGGVSDLLRFWRLPYWGIDSR